MYIDLYWHIIFHNISLSYIIFQLSSFRELDKFLQGQQAGSFHIFLTVTLHFIPYISLHYIPLPYITFQLSSFRESDRFLTEAAGAGLEDRRPTSEAGLEQKETLECLTDHPDDINIPHIIALLAPHTFSLHLLVHLILHVLVCQLVHHLVHLLVHLLLCWNVRL